MKPPPLPRSGIYSITHVASGKCYVGSAISIPARWRAHRYELRHNKHHSRFLQFAWNKYGEDAFRFEVLHICVPSLLYNWEQAWIDFLQPKFNMCRFVESRISMPLSDEHKKKLSEAHKGKPKSEEHRLKIGIGLKSSSKAQEQIRTMAIRPKSEGHRKKISDALTRAHAEGRH